MWRRSVYLHTLTKLTPELINCRSAFKQVVLWKSTIDKSRFPEIVESDLEEQFVRGSGPGGQAVNKTSNAVVLKHIPSGTVVKCHESRSLEHNRKVARKELLNRLDVLYNGEMSVSAQIKRIEEIKTRTKERKARIRREMKKEFKEREGLE
jgi:protein subunit release factor B